MTMKEMPNPSIEGTPNRRRLSLVSLHHIALVVRDPARTAQIFRTLFNASVVPSSHEHRGPTEMLVHIGETTLVLVRGESTTTRTDNHIAFAVEEQELPILADRLASMNIEGQVSRSGPAAKLQRYAG